MLYGHVKIQKPQFFYALLKSWLTRRVRLAHEKARKEKQRFFHVAGPRSFSVFFCWLLIRFPFYFQTWWVGTTTISLLDSCITQCSSGIVFYICNDVTVFYVRRYHNIALYFCGLSCFCLPAFPISSFASRQLGYVLSDLVSPAYLSPQGLHFLARKNIILFIHTYMCNALLTRQSLMCPSLQVIKYLWSHTIWNERYLLLLWAQGPGPFRPYFKWTERRLDNGIILSLLHFQIF